MPRLSTSGRADNLHGIVVFLRVVDAGSLSRAARSLGVSPSAVSATLARLEERLETRLLKTDGHVISAVFPKEQPYSPKIRAFVDFLARQFDPPPWTKRPPQAPAKKMSAEFAGGRSVLRPDFTRPQERPAVKRPRRNRIRGRNASA
jgi:regulatory helix-turn-helix LysR family protein